MRLLFVALLLGPPTSATFGATYTLTPVVAAVFDPSFIPIAFDPLDPVSPAVLQVNVFLEFSSPDPDEDFGNIVFNLLLDNLTPNPLAPAWNANNPIVDCNCPIPAQCGCGSPFRVNADVGMSRADFQFILVSVDSGIEDQLDPRRRIGQDGPWLLGSVFLDYSGGFSSSRVEPLQASVIDIDGLLVFDRDASLVVAPVQFFPIVPEPSAFLLITGCAGALSVGRRG